MGTKQNVDISSSLVVDMQLSIEANAQVVDVQAEANHISIDPTENGDALVLHEGIIRKEAAETKRISGEMDMLTGRTCGGYTGSRCPKHGKPPSENAK